MRLIQIFIGFILLTCTIPCFSTEQVPDIVIYNEETCLLKTHWAYPSPLEVYYQYYSQSSPFFGDNTANYRGFIATWELRNEYFSLVDISLEPAWGVPDDKGEKIDLRKIFFEQYVNGKVKATWFTGVILIQASPYKIWYDSKWNPGKKEYYINYKSFVFAEIKNGNVMNTVELSSEKYWKISDNEEKNKKIVTEQEAAVITKYYEYIKKKRSRILEKASEQEVLKRKDQFLQASLYIHSVYQIRKRKIDAENERQRIMEEEKAASVYTTVNGYIDAMNIFEIYKASVMNFETDNGRIKLRMNVKNADIINEVWWDAYIRNVNTKYSWYTVISLYDKTKSIIERHRWLVKWAVAVKGRSLVLRISGKRPSYLMGKDYVSVWKHAGLIGSPYYQIQLWQDGKPRGHFFLGEEDSQLLIVEMHMQDYKYGDPDYYNEDAIREEIEKTGEYWLDKVNFEYNKKQTIPNYIIVSGDGIWQTNTLPWNTSHN